MGIPSSNVQYHPPRLSEDRLNLPQPHSPPLPTHCSGKSGMRPAYLESVRDVERRIQMAQEQSARELPTVEQPAGAPASFEEYGELMFDLMALAYETDLTRVATFMLGREESSRTYPEIGVPEPHHPVSHHQNRPEPLEKLGRINAFHMKLFAHFLDKLKSTSDGDGSLLDNSMLISGAGISNSDVHYHHDLPILGYIRVSQLMKCPDEACFIAVSTYLTGYATGSESVQEPTVR